MHRYLLALVLLLASSRPIFAQPVPGCMNGVLDDPRAYFFALIGRAEGQPANDFAEVLRASGIPAGYGPGVVPGDNGFYGLTQQIGGGGRIAGRIFLPTAQPDELGYYSHPISPLRDGPTPGSLVWEWRDLGGPPYAPRSCRPVTPPPATHVPPATDAVLEAMAALRQQVESLTRALEELKARPVPCFSGRIGGIAPVTLCPK